MSTYEHDEAAVDAMVRALESIVPNSNGVLWMFTHSDGQEEPVTLRYAAQVALRAVRQADAV